MVFTINYSIVKLLADTELKSETKNLIAGMISGALSLSVFVPFDLLKCRA